MGAKEAAAPEISVVVTARDRAAGLRRSVRSVLAQTHRNLELIVVSETADDETRRALGDIDDDRLRIIRCGSNLTAAAARNHGIEATRGEFVAFQDDGDVWLVEKLERQLEALRQSHAKWCLAAFVRLREDGARYVGGPRCFDQLDYRRGIGVGGPDWSMIVAGNWLVTRALLLETGGFDETIRSCHDWELALRLSQRTRAIHVNELLWLQGHLRRARSHRAEDTHADDMRIISEKHGGHQAEPAQGLARAVVRFIRNGFKPYRQRGA